jgi:hypothetical protein
MKGLGHVERTIDMIHTEFSLGNLQEVATWTDLRVDGRTVLK